MVELEPVHPRLKNEKNPWFSKAYWNNHQLTDKREPTDFPDTTFLMRNLARRITGRFVGEGELNPTATYEDGQMFNASRYSVGTVVRIDEHSIAEISDGFFWAPFTTYIGIVYKPSGKEKVIAALRVGGPSPQIPGVVKTEPGAIYTFPGKFGVGEVWRSEVNPDFGSQGFFKPISVQVYGETIDTGKTVASRMRQIFPRLVRRPSLQVA